MYRQGGISLAIGNSENEDLNLSGFLKRERNVLHEFLYHKIKQISHWGHPQEADLNKLEILEKAVGFNLLVPEYIFTGYKFDLLEFCDRHKKVITKTISPAYYYFKDNARYGCYTELLNPEEIKSTKSRFHPTFFQRFIPKKFDVRVFYCDETFYPIAIMSQNSNQTKVDFRMYDEELRNRNVPILLPVEIKKDLRKLIAHLNLAYCSVDFVYGEDKKFYFLEINPIGQFGNVSYFGNYHLEKKIAEFLCV